MKGDPTLIRQGFHPDFRMFMDGVLTAMTLDEWAGRIEKGARAQERPADPPGLVRAIGRWDLTAAIINGLIGSAIFSLPAPSWPGSPGAGSPLAFVLAGLGMLAMLLCFAEVASRFRTRAGRTSTCARPSGRASGFQAGWLTFWIRVTSAGREPQRLRRLPRPVRARAGDGGGPRRDHDGRDRRHHRHQRARRTPGHLDRGLLHGRPSSLPLALLIVLGLPRVSARSLATQAVAHPDWTQAILLLVFAYGGFESPLIPAGEAATRGATRAFALHRGAGRHRDRLLARAARGGGRGARAWPGRRRRWRRPSACCWGRPGVVLIAARGHDLDLRLATGSVLQSPRLLYSMASAASCRRSSAACTRASARPTSRSRSTPRCAGAARSTAASSGTPPLSAIVRLVTYGLTCAALLVLRRRGRRGARLPARRAPGDRAGRGRLLRSGSSARAPSPRPGSWPR